MRPIVVLIGAGASHTSGTYTREQRPPLTTQLFDTDVAKQLLAHYDLARQARSAMKRDVADKSAPAFEAALRQLQDDGQPHHRQMAQAVPPFLQALLLQYSAMLRAEASRYEVLIDELLKIGTPIVFVSLNYDTLLDNNLAAFSPLDALSDYLDDGDRGWSLIKPHGSVAWYIEQDSFFDPRTPRRGLDLRRAPIECVPTTTFDLARVRDVDPGEAHASTTRYPALALPDRPKDQLVLPPSHLQNLEYTLADAPEIDLLVLGYSGLDTEVLELIRRGGCKLRRMTIVNANAQSSLEVLDRLTTAGIDSIWPDPRDEDFAQWIDSGQVRTWAREYEGPFNSVTAPDVLRRLILSRKYEAEAIRHGDALDIMDADF